MEPEAVWTELSQLTVGPSPRMDGVNRAHVAALAELQGRWPPILVGRSDGRLIDGHHRVAAARLLGWSRLPVLFFDGTDDDAFIESIRRNVDHGLPLTIEERKMAAGRLLDAHHDWSDRRIAEICALSARTVARLRAVSGHQSDGVELRVCRDGRKRPANVVSTHLRIVEAVRSNPAASLRVIARSVGSSPETVRRVKRDMTRRRSSLAPVQEDAPAGTNTLPAVEPEPPLVADFWPSATDRAITSTPDGEEFADWFDRTDIRPDWRAHVMSVPLSRVYEVADDARRRARVWSEFSQVLEERARTSGASSHLAG
jgi:ParB/Sulfiredoxin domain